MTDPTSVTPSKAVTVMDGMRYAMQQMRPEFEKVLPQGVTAEKFVRTVITAIQTNPALAEPSIRASLMNACMKAAADGLLPDGRESALLIRNNKEKTPDGDKWRKEVNYQAMVAGDIKFMRQRAGVLSMAARVVHQNDEYLFVYGDNERFEHTPLMAGEDERGKIIAAYVIARMRNGGIERELMTVGEIENTRKQSKQPDSLMWSKFYSEGCKKTVIKRLRKRLPGAEMEADEEDFDDERAVAVVAHDDPQPAVTGSVRNPALQHIVDTANGTGPETYDGVVEYGARQEGGLPSPDDELI
ncbi:MAG: recombinase RecT [Alphaproteobacteria bacterium]